MTKHLRGAVRRLVARALLLATAVSCAGCAGTRPGPSAALATEAEWRMLAEPRPEPLPSAPAVAVAEVRLVGSVPWPVGTGVEPPLGVSELVATGLLRRRDVTFVERRRFAVAARAERAGTSRPEGAPAAGVSRPADFILTASWIPVADRWTVDVRLAEATTGTVVASRRDVSADEPSAVGIARAVVRGTLAALDEQGVLPAWEDPSAPPDGSTSSDPVSSDALVAFLRGLAAEERWDWERARLSYGVASRDAAFYEARAALARTARLRLGGTLGES